MTLAHRPQDWHLACEFPDYQAYTCPAVFQDDWLNEWFDWQQRQQQEAAPAPQQAEQADVDGQQQQSAGAGGIQASDYRFVYLGPAVSNQDSVTAAMRYNGALLRHSSHPSLTAYPWAGASAHWFVPHALLLQGTSTPLHADVLRSFSWSANIAGRKLWRLLPPQVPGTLLGSWQPLRSVEGARTCSAGAAAPCRLMRHHARSLPPVLLL